MGADEAVFLTDLAHDTVNFGLYDDVNIAEM